ncbi:coiled-coil and C2 domain-containing protein 1A isoform X2 [Falco naumanni]|uniref:coiled-coil and C2 domain-containing protein 1A isoform X2 n=1 Tax=Falco naumanni TaxID=148594 RepID=UPI001ADEAC77|nr:coiled-coil and C2 domain-containing protein 1A isoform X2 [Falco naumanni]
MSRARRLPPGHGAAIARQMGLLVDLSPEGMVGDAAVDDAAELEAELLALVGGRAAPGEKPEGKTPLPMEAIEEMAALCMKDPDEEEGDDNEELEDEDDLMAELQEVLGEGEGSTDALVPPAKVPEPLPAESSGVEATLTERTAMYRAAIANARQAGDGSRLRRYERGLKTLESMLASVRKGNKIEEEEIPPPVALGKGLSSPQPPPPPAGSLEPPQVLPGGSSPPPAPASPASHPGSAGAEAVLRGRQREYKLAALRAKQRGDLEAATRCYRLAKSLDSLLDAAQQGQPVELSSVPPPPAQAPEEPLSPTQPQPEPQPASPTAAAPPAPRDALEALQQRMERYVAAAAQARSKGDDRKARMHERIVKQYQDAIRAHKAGKTVDFSELPIPPGFPPIQGAETPSGEQSLAGVLEVAARLASQEVRDEEEGDEEAQPTARPAPVRASTPQPKAPPPPPRAAPHPAAVTKAPPKPTGKAQQQLAFLEGRRRQLAQAALRAKQSRDIEGAKLLLRQAKGLDAMIAAARGGLPVDITKVPEAPVNKEDFVLVQRGACVPPEAASRYLELVRVIRQQHEMCVSHSKQFTHLGNIAETTKFERLAEDCRQHMAVLKQAHARGYPPPRHHYEQRTFSVIKSFPELNGSDMVLCIVKGINLPAPPGVAPTELDAFVRFEFPYPSAEEAQKDKTNVVKNTDSPEFKEQFKLHMNRGHRGLRRVLHTKGIRFEVAHKGGLFKPDRPLGTAQLKLEALETSCELREILELLEGRRPTGGKLEVTVRIREPLGCPQLETRTERWLVIDTGTGTGAAVTGHKPPGEATGRAVPPLPSLTLLAFDRERLERKMLAHTQAQRPVPPELRQQHQELVRRSQSLRTRLQHGGAPLRREYQAQLERYLQLYTEAARRLGTEGQREAAKEALYKRNLVESELQKLRR